MLLQNPTTVIMKAASALTSSSIAHPRRAISHIRTYNWPPLQLNFWIFVMLISSASIVGVFSTFVQIQLQLNLPIPWYFSRHSSSSPSFLYLLTRSHQVFPLLYYGWMHCPSLYWRDILAHRQPPPITGHCHDWRLCALRHVARRTGCRVCTALGTRRLYTEYLQSTAVQ